MLSSIVSTITTPVRRGVRIKRFDVNAQTLTNKSRQFSHYRSEAIELGGLPADGCLEVSDPVTATVAAVVEDFDDSSHVVVARLLVAVLPL